MTLHQNTQLHRQSKTYTPISSNIAQRSDINSIPEKALPPTQTESKFHHDFSQVPVSSLSVQAKLQIGAVGDKYEQEADRVANQVVSNMNASGNQTVQREEMIPEDEDKDKLQMKPIVQRQSVGSGLEVTPDLETSIQQSRSTGQPLSATVQKPMEKAFGFDFSGVRVHTDQQSNQLNQSLQAAAFTTGQDIFFSQGKFNPSSSEGTRLLAHELTHVVQQSGKN